MKTLIVFDLHANLAAFRVILKRSMVTTILLYTCALSLPAAAAGKDTDDLTGFLLSEEGKQFLSRPIPSLQTWEALTGHAVFLRGPHRENPDYFSRKDFGHYNPEFINYVIDKLLPEEIPGPHKGLLWKLVSQYSVRGRRIRDLAAAQRFIACHPKEYRTFKKAYLELIERGEPYSSYGPLKKWDNPDDGYIAADLAFWVRRDQDGTAPILVKGLGRLAGCLEDEKLAATVPCGRKDGQALKSENDVLADIINGIQRSGTAGGYTPNEKGQMVKFTVQFAEGYTGDRNFNEIRSHLFNRIGGIKYQYHKQLRKTPGLRGIMSIRFVIRQNGMVTGFRVLSSDMKCPELEELLQNLINRWRFAASDGGEAPIDLHLTFRQGGR